MKVWIVVLNWNGKSRLPIALGGLNKLEGEFTLLISDNGSTDGSLGIINDHFSGIYEVLLNGENLGFAEGNNRAIQYAIDRGADFIALVNDDLVLNPNWLVTMLEVMSNNSNVAVAGGTILFLDRPNVVNSTAIAVDCFYRSPDENFEQLYRPQDLAERNVKAVSGGAMFLRVSALEKIGMFRSEFFAYFEDVDLCLRARKFGYDVRTVPRALSYHKYNGTFSQFQEKKVFLLSRNHFYLVGLHASLFYFVFLSPIFLFYRALKATRLFFGKQEKKLAYAEWRGSVEGFSMGLKAALKKSQS